MTKTDWTPDSQPSDEADPLSATGMFLSSFGKEAEQPQKPAEPSFSAPVAPPAAWQPEPAFTPSQQATPAASQGGPGEFTKLFQASQASQAAAPTTPPADLTPAPSFEPRPAPAPPPAGASAPGEFTRIFVKSTEAKPAERAPAPPPRSIPDLPPAPAPAPGAPRMKGFSSGSSDSASVEGGFTQFFQPRPAGAASPPAPVSAPPTPPYTPPAPAPVAPPAEFKWPAPSDFGASKTPAESPTGSTSATNLFASLAATEARPETVKAAPVEPLPSYTPTPSYSPAATPSYSSAPLPSYTAAPPAAPSGPEAGSVTRLIQRLSEGTKAPPMVETSGAAAPPPPPVDSGPGEFTRMISTSTLRTPASAPPPAAAPAAGGAPVFTIPPIPKPAIAMPPMPAAPPPPAMAAPKFEAPKAPAAPKLAPPAVAAPAGKFQEMVPILLVVNTFLLLVLILLAIFELKGK